MKKRVVVASVLAGTILLASACGSAPSDAEGALDGEETGIETETQLPPVELSGAVIEAIPDEIYTGTAITVSPSIEVDGRTLTEGVDYTLSFENNTNIGTAVVMIIGNGTSALGQTSTTFNIITGDEICDDEANSGIVDFVYRLYVYLLGRNPSIDELTDSVRRLHSGSRSGMEAVNIILQSQEFSDRNLSDDVLLESFYLGVLNRPADGNGMAYNLNLLSSGMSREELLNSIMGVPGGEFDTLCSSIGVSLGTGSVLGQSPVIYDGIPTSVFNYTVDGREVSIHRRVYQFISTTDDGQSVFDLTAMCAASGLAPLSDDGSFVYGSGVYELSLEGGAMSLKISSDEVSYYEDVVDEGEETFSVNGTDTTVSLGMIVMIESSLESLG